jgi:putative hydrolase of the HAD superfamily
MFDLIAFDADDTLWHNERLYSEVQARFKALLEPYLGHADGIEERLYATEIHNLAHYGYGIKAFTLSLIETAIEMTQGRVTAADISAILTLGRGMLAAEVELLPHVAEVIPTLAEKYPLMIITKGDLLDQEAKVVRSGLGRHFRTVEIVSHKTPESYAAILTKHGIEAARFLMVGNSLKSDVLPVIAVGGHAVYVPHPLTWAAEHADPSAEDRARYHEIAHLGELIGLVDRLVADA